MNFAYLVGFKNFLGISLAHLPVRIKKSPGCPF
jgi:hypothetical protein